MAAKKAFKQDVNELFMGTAQEEAKKESALKAEKTPAAKKPAKKTAAKEPTTREQRAVARAKKLAKEAAKMKSPIKGYKLVPESKTERMQLLLKPATKADIVKAAKKARMSVNEFVSAILEDYLEEGEE